MPKGEPNERAPVPLEYLPVSPVPDGRFPEPGDVSEDGKYPETTEEPVGNGAAVIDTSLPWPEPDGFKPPSELLGSRLLMEKPLAELILKEGSGVPAAVEDGNSKSIEVDIPGELPSRVLVEKPFSELTPREGGEALAAVEGDSPVLATADDSEGFPPFAGDVLLCSI